MLEELQLTLSLEERLFGCAKLVGCYFYDPKHKGSYIWIILGLRPIRTFFSLRAQHASRMATPMIGTVESRRAISYTRSPWAIYGHLGWYKTTEGMGED